MSSESFDPIVLAFLHFVWWWCFRPPQSDDEQATVQEQIEASKARTPPCPSANEILVARAAVPVPGSPPAHCPCLA